MTQQTLTITQPDDWHIHLRQDAFLALTVPHVARTFARAIVMPNLKPPVTTTAKAKAYHQDILSHIPAGVDFTPLMTLYLTDNTSADEIKLAKASGVVHAVKYYPAGATTNSDFGVTNIRHAYPALEALQKHSLPLLIHGEVTDPSIDIFDREAVFIDTELAQIHKDFPELKIVLEHITTKQAVDFVIDTNKRVAATITVHHLMYNRNEIFKGGVRPHYYCLPILKREPHRQALVNAATSGNAKFFLGTDSAPHLQHDKESHCGCAGIYTAHAAIELYASVFEAAGKLDKLEGFASLNGPAFYDLPVNQSTITLEKQTWDIPNTYDYGQHGKLVPLEAGQSIDWKLK